MEILRTIASWLCVERMWNTPASRFVADCPAVSPYLRFGRLPIGNSPMAIALLPTNRPGWRRLSRAVAAARMTPRRP